MLKGRIEIRAIHPGTPIKATQRVDCLVDRIDNQITEDEHIQVKTTVVPRRFIFSKDRLDAENMFRSWGSIVKKIARFKKRTVDARSWMAIRRWFCLGQSRASSAASLKVDARVLWGWVPMMETL